MLRFVKILIIFSKTKNGNYSEDEIKYVSDKDASEFLEKMPIESLIRKNWKRWNISSKRYFEFKSWIYSMCR